MFNQRAALVLIFKKKKKVDSLSNFWLCWVCLDFPPVAVHGLLFAVDSLVAEHGL